MKRATSYLIRANWVLISYTLIFCLYKLRKWHIEDLEHARGIVCIGRKTKGAKIKEDDEDEEGEEEEREEEKEEGEEGEEERG